MGLRGNKLSDLYSELVVTKTVADDCITIKLKFSNDKPGGMTVVIDTINPFDGNERFLPYPAGDIHVKFDDSKLEYIADTGTLKDFLEIIECFVLTITETMMRDVD